MYTPVDAVIVRLWGRRVGALINEREGFTSFQYDPEFVKSGLAIAPLMMPLSNQIYTSADFQVPRNAFFGLPGVFADSLPDSFGNKLVKDWMISQGYSMDSITVLDRLSYVGDRGMGALTYEPAMFRGNSDPTVLDMKALVEEARLALNADLSKLGGAEALRRIIRVGTSAGGAQAKAVVGWNRDTGEFLVGSGDLPEGFEHWLIKFTPYGIDDAGEKEYEFYRMALECGIVMSECRIYELDGRKHFMTKRFDRDGNRRFHTQTYCAMKHLPHLSPVSLCTYEGIFETSFDLGLGYEDREQLFRRMAFNVYTREMDDHTKNFSFLMRENGKWELAPAYDLTGYHFSVDDPTMFEFSNRHALSVNGKFSSITDEDLLTVAERYGIGTARKVLKRIKEVVC